MRRILVLDPDVLAIIDRERRPGESVGTVVNRLIRSSHRSEEARLDLPRLPGTLQVDIADVSEVVADLDDGE